MAAPEPVAPTEVWPVPHDSRALGERGLREAMRRLEQAWQGGGDQLGRETDESVIARHVQDRLVPLVEALQWVFSLDEHYRGRGGSYARDVTEEPAGQVVRGLSLVRNRAAHQLAAVLGWWWTPVDVPEDWADRPHRIEAVPIQRNGSVSLGEAAYIGGLDVPVAIRDDASEGWMPTAGRLRRFSLAWRAWEELPDVPERHRIQEGDERLIAYRHYLQGRDVLTTIEAAATFLASRS
jgi:hypothetical protein